MRHSYFAALSVSLAVATAPASAQQGLFTKENIGKAVGAAAGALLGSRVGGGKGKLAAVAIGTLAGYWVGGEVGRRLSQNDRAGIAHTTQQALNTGETQTWRNPDSGVYTRVAVEDTPAPVTRDSGPRPSLADLPPLELVNAYYIAEANVNVRTGPSTDYPILHTLPRGAKVPVVGRVEDSGWLMIAEDGVGSGFLYGPILSRADNQPESGNAIRQSMGRAERPQRYVAAREQCRRITQEVVLPNGKKSVHAFTACRQPDGSWTEV